MDGGEEKHSKDENSSFLCGLTFELSGRQRQGARPGLAKMYRVPPARAWWPAVGAPLERGVRPQSESHMRVKVFVRGRHTKADAALPSAKKRIASFFSLSSAGSPALHSQ